MCDKSWCDGVETKSIVKKKREKAEDFIGWKSEDGKLEVIGTCGKTKSGNALYKVTCKVCSKDKELFPDGYFIATKGMLLNGNKPCGCAAHRHWTPEQYLLKAQRSGSKKHFKVHGFIGEYNGVHTELDCECLIDGHRWIPTVNKIVNGRENGCPECKRTKARLVESDVLKVCEDLCNEVGYEFLGFPDGYQHNQSRFEYICPKHGKRDTMYSSFVSGRSRCGLCWKERQKEILRDASNGNGYYPQRKDEQDFLYVLNFDDKFIKIGRSFDVDDRIKDLRKPTCSGIRDIIKLKVFTATHKEVYDYEQEILNELRPKYQYFCDWTTETLRNESLPELNKILDNCNFIRTL